MIIAERVLKMRAASSILDLPIRIFAPQRSAAGSWSCRYEIDWPDGKWSMDAGGVDSVQALSLALQMIGSELYTSGYHRSGDLYFDAPGRGYGFPVAATLRDRLVGDDRTFL